MVLERDTVCAAGKVLAGERRIDTKVTEQRPLCGFMRDGHPLDP
jgi:hypothetical protein